MNDGTKKLFDAPWEVGVCEKGNPEFESLFIASKTGCLIARDMEEETAERIVRLPELYDALMYFVVNDCPHAFISNDECRLCPNKKCKTREAVELLRKVRDGK